MSKILNGMILIVNGQLINRNKIFRADLLICDGKILEIRTDIPIKDNYKIIDAKGKYILPGIIDDQVHFREPGLTHKANVFSESRAAVAGGTTTFMEMPNTKPPAITQKELEKKYITASETSLANYSFFMGATNDNLEEVLKTNPKNVCGIKIFMGSSTGNMLVDNPVTLEDLFSQVKMLIATHCEDEETIRKNTEIYIEKYGEDIPIACHPEIRNDVGCYISSSMAVELAKKHGTRLHILHISTAKEIALFENEMPLENKKITAEVCVHHLFFNDEYYDTLGTKIKCNPAIKSKKDQEAIFQALLDDKLDIIATDHAPHTISEKDNKYLKAPSGLPLVQHALYVMLDFYKKGMISLERIVDKMCHAPARCFNVEKRGFLDEGYWADIVILDLEGETKITKDNILYKCGWSPLENMSFKGEITHTIVNGNVVYQDGQIIEGTMGKRVLFNP